MLCLAWLVCYSELILIQWIRSGHCSLGNPLCPDEPGSDQTEFSDATAQSSSVTV